MGYELLISAKHSGKIWDCSNNVTEATWETNRTGSPGKFTFTLIKAGGIAFFEGDVVRFSVDGQLQFYGWIFTKVKDRYGIIQCTCYDRLRYLKANGSYSFYGATAGEIIREIAEDLQLTTGTLADTGYTIPSLIEEDQCCLDIISGAIQQTLLSTGKVYVFYDDGEGVSLRAAADMKSDIMIGTQSYLLDYTYTTDIDKETYNSIKLVQPNEDTGKADVYLFQDSATIPLWGLLQLYQTVDSDMNIAQIVARGNVSLQYYDKRRRTLSCSSLGVPGLRAGMMVLMKVPDLGDISLDQYVLLEKVTHTWREGEHTMEFDTLSLINYD